MKILTYKTTHTLPTQLHIHDIHTYTHTLKKVHNNKSLEVICICNLLKNVFITSYEDMYGT